MIRLHLLGAIDLRDEDGREVRPVLAQPKRLALLAYLAAASPRGPHRRDTLLGIFWPELDQDHARNALSKAVHFLRRSLGEAALVSRNAEELGLDGAVVWTDVAAFDAAVHAGRTEEALGLYRGDLLPSFFVPDAPAFEEWLERERTGLRARAAEAARLLAERHEASGEATQAIECARRAVALSNGDERPLRRLVELLDRLGDRSGALHAYDSFARRLAAELEVEPAGETIALIERIRASGPPRATPTVEPIAQEASQPAVGHAETDVASRQPPGHRRRLPTIAAAIAGLGILGALALVRFLRPAPIPALDADLVAVAPFEVLDPTLALWREGIVDVLSRDLDGAGRLHSVSPAVAIQRWRGRAEAGAAQALGRRTGARLVVFGQLMGSGADSVRLRATLVDAGGGRTIGEVELRDAAIHMDGLLESLTLKLLQELGRDRPVGAVRQGALGVRPLPALKAFLRGEQFYRRMLWDSAAAHYDHAIALDSGFALAYYRMAMAVGWNSEQSKRYRAPEEYARRAALLNQGQTTRDSLLLVYGPFEMLRDPADAGYFARYRQGLAVLERASQLYPGDPEVWYMLGEARDHIHSNDVTLAQTLDAFDRAIELDSTFGPAYKHTVEFAIRLGDTDRARKYAAAYLASTPTGVSIPSLRIDGLLLDPARAGSAETARLVDTVVGVELWLSWWDLAQWPDSGETSIRLARALLRPDRSFMGAPPYMVDSINRRKILARMLAFRGRLREAYRTAPPYSFRWPLVWLHPFPDLALLGAVPADSPAAVFGRMLRGDSLLAADGEQRDGLPWWNAVRDSTSLALFARRADSAARYRSNPIDRAHLRALGDAARAYLVLAKGDSADGLRAFAALPDSLCLLTDCFFDKLTQMRLAAALGQDRSAAEIFDRWIFGRHLSPVGVLGTLERGRIAERLGQRDKAIQSYRFVADAWRNADPELQPYVAEAREGLKRVIGEIH
jgi:eukaryotic-like serine/threonine-protein kinase